MNILIVEGHFCGKFLIERLLEEEHTITVLSKDQNFLKKLSGSYDLLTLHVEGTWLKSLKEAQIGKMDLVLLLSDNEEENVLLSFYAKYYGVSKKIISVSSPLTTIFPETTQSFIEEWGGALAIDHYKVCSDEIIRMIQMSTVNEFVDFFSGRVILVSVVMSEEQHPLLTGTLKSLQDNEFLKKFRIVSLKRGVQTIVPNGKTTIQVGDELFIMMKKKDLPRILRWLKVPLWNPEKFVLLGYSMLSVRLARILEKRGGNVSLVVPDKRDAERAARQLSQTSVFYGDLKDQSLLDELSLLATDMFISLTDSDEMNVLMALLSKKNLVKKSMCVVQSDHYDHFFPDLLKTNDFVSTQKIFVNALMRKLNLSETVDLTVLKNIDAEVLEVQINEESSYLNKKIKEMSLPEGVIIGTIVRNGEPILAGGSHEIECFDKLLVFYHSRNRKTVYQTFSIDHGLII